MRLVDDAGKTRRNDVRLAVDGESDMADESLIEDRIDGFAIERPAVWKPLKSRSFCLSNLRCHRFSRRMELAPIGF
jgi:hypothetical protein